MHKNSTRKGTYHLTVNQQQKINQTQTNKNPKHRFSLMLGINSAQLQRNKGILFVGKSCPWPYRSSLETRLITGGIRELGIDLNPVPEVHFYLNYFSKILFKMVVYP